MTRKPKSAGSNVRLIESVRELGQLKEALQTLASLLPERTTLRQATAFSAVLWANAMGHQVTLSDVVAELGDDEDGMPILGNSPERVMDKFKSPSRKERDAVAKLPPEERPAAMRQLPRGWIEAVENEDDRRHKFLELTPAGLRVAELLAECIRGDDHEATR